MFVTRGCVRRLHGQQYFQQHACTHTTYLRQTHDVRLTSNGVAKSHVHSDEPPQPEWTEMRKCHHMHATTSVASSTLMGMQPSAHAPRCTLSIDPATRGPRRNTHSPSRWVPRAARRSGTAPRRPLSQCHQRTIPPHALAQARLAHNLLGCVAAAEQWQLGRRPHMQAAPAARPRRGPCKLRKAFEVGSQREAPPVAQRHEVGVAPPIERSMRMNCE